MPRMLIVIVNYRTPDLTVECLASLEAEVRALGQVDVVVTDNLSGDDSVQRIGEAIQSRGWGWARLMPLPRNGGFAYGNNAAIAPALADENPPELIYLLNPDVIARPGVLTELLRFAESQPKAGIIGTRIENPDGSARRTAFRFHTVAGEFESMCRIGLVSRLLHRWNIAPLPPEVPQQVGWVSGASMLVRREVFEQTGLLDEGFFMYYEEQDFIRRAADVGWPCWYLPKSRIVHLVGQASGVTRSGPPRRRPAYWFESRRRYWAKHHAWPIRFASALAFLGGLCCWRVYRLLRRKPPIDPPHLATDFIRYCVLPHHG